MGNRSSTATTMTDLSITDSWLDVQADELQEVVLTPLSTPMRESTPTPTPSEVEENSEFYEPEEPVLDQRTSQALRNRVSHLHKQERVASNARQGSPNDNISASSTRPMKKQRRNQLHLEHQALRYLEKLDDLDERQQWRYRSVLKGMANRTKQQAKRDRTKNHKGRRPTATH